MRGEKTDYKKKQEEETSRLSRTQEIREAEVQRAGGSRQNKRLKKSESISLENKALVLDP